MKAMRSLGLLVAFAILLSLLLSAPDVGASNPTAPIVDPHGRPYGKSYGQWSAEWWQWVLSFPFDTNPLFQDGAVDCSRGAAGHVWFLAGALGSGTYNRTCTVPNNVGLFFPVANMIAWATEPEETYEGMLTIATDALNTAYDIQADVDGVAVQNLNRYRVTSPGPFAITIPEGGIVDPGTYSPSASDGYYLMLTPLSPGQHTVHIHAVWPGWGTMDVTYTLTVSTKHVP